jgi:hypothetical protein
MIDWGNPYILGAGPRHRVQNFFPGDFEDCSDEQSVDDDFGHRNHTTALVLRSSLGTDIYVTRVVKDGRLDNSKNIADVKSPSQIL